MICTMWINNNKPNINRMKKIIFLLAALIGMTSATSAKKVLDHSSFDDWKSVAVSPLAKDGSWAAYAVNPQEGDGILTFRNVKSGKEINIPRGYRPQFSDNARWAVALIKPYYLDTRKAKIDKKKEPFFRLRTYHNIL